MSYKDLNVYQRAYKVAIDLHLFLEKDDTKIAPDQKRELNRASRELLGNIAEGVSQKTPKAKRFFNFKARDRAHQLLMDIEFLHDVGVIPAEEYNKFQEEYSICAAMLWKLNKSILEKSNESTETQKQEVNA